jgi:thioesterase domain-containing protein
MHTSSPADAMADAESNSISIEKLAEIWQNVLRRSPIRLEDNFFALGGTPALAVKLCDEIAGAFGVEVPALVVFHAPTLAALADILREPSFPEFSPLVPLRASDENSPVFIAHGLGGSAMEFFDLVRSMEMRHSVYGLQGMAPSGSDIAFERIEDMAAFYIDGLRNKQPHGPYFLVGYSLGGLVAFEIAQRLSDMGEEIRLLALVDSYPYASFRQPWQLARRTTLRLKRHLSIVKGLPLRQGLSYVFDPAERAQHLPGKGAEELIREPFTEAMRQARDKAYLALTRYKPRPYLGKIKFVKAAKKSIFPTDPIAAWAPWANTLEVDTVPGDHYGMLGEHFGNLASVLSRYLREVG